MDAVTDTADWQDPRRSAVNSSLPIYRQAVLAYIC